MELLFDKIKNPVIETERLIINDVTPDDKMEYYALYTDDKLNKYWGYDYHEDLPENKEPSPDYFYGFMTSLKNKKEEYSGIISETYNYIFIMKTDSDEVKSFSYRDVLTNTIELFFDNL